jgi:hypothetical protein
MRTEHFLKATQISEFSNQLKNDPSFLIPYYRIRRIV